MLLRSIAMNCSTRQYFGHRRLDVTVSVIGKYTIYVHTYIHTYIQTYIYTLTCLGARLAGTVHCHLDRLAVRRDLRGWRIDGNGDAEALAWNRHIHN